MKAVWKFDLTTLSEQVLSMPENSEIINVQMQNGKPVLWAIVDTNAIKKERKFYCAYTGEGLPANPLMYVGTYQLGGLVYHLFELK